MNFWLDRKNQQAVWFSDYVVWGSKTLQRPPTALDRVGIRRMMIYIESQARGLFKEQICEGHDCHWLEHRITELLSIIRSRGGIHEYNLVADDQCVYIGTQFRANSEWIYIELERR